jgi:hypothetical protein
VTVKADGEALEGGEIVTIKNTNGADSTFDRFKRTFTQMFGKPESPRIVESKAAVVSATTEGDPKI